MPHTNSLELLPNQGWDERILLCQNGRLVTTAIIVTQRYVVLFDTLINPTTARTMVEFARPHLTGKRQLLVINSHADYDHAWGNQLFVGPQAEFPAPIFGTRLCLEQFKAIGSTWLGEFQKSEPEIFTEVVLTPPTIGFEGEMILDGGDLTLRLIPTPGHTVDHLSLYIPEIRTLLAADAAEIPYPAARTPDGLPVMRQSLAKLAALGAENAIYCHATPMIGPQLLHDNIRYFDLLEERCRAALACGVVVEATESTDVAALIGLRYGEATPNNEYWVDVNPWYGGEGHAEQIRMMLQMIAR